jgi:hypothetical protein
MRKAEEGGKSGRRDGGKIERAGERR